MITYPLEFTLDDGTKVSVNPIENSIEKGQRLMFDLTLPDGTADSFVWSSLADPKEPSDPSQTIPHHQMNVLHAFWQIERNS